MPARPGGGRSLHACVQLFSAFVGPGRNSHGGSLRACKPSCLQQNSGVVERGSSVGFPSVPQSWEAAISARLDQDWTWAPGGATPSGLRPRDPGGERTQLLGGAPGEKERQLLSSFHAPASQGGGQEPTAVSTQHPPGPLSPIVKLSAAALMSLLPARSPLKNPGGFSPAATPACAPVQRT